MHECMNALTPEWLTHQLLKHSSIRLFASLAGKTATGGLFLLQLHNKKGDP